MIWSETFSVDSHDIDYNGVARASAVLRYMQECANRQVKALGPTAEELRRQGQVFLLSSAAAQIHAPLRAYEQIQGDTWACDSHGYSFPRCHQLKDGDAVLAEAVTVWALVDIKTRHPLRTEVYHPNFTTAPRLSLSLPARISLPTDMEECGTHRVVYSETDLNRHLNNTRYLDMICDFLPLDGCYVSSFAIQYVSEAPLGTLLRCYRTRTENGGWIFKSIREDGNTNAIAQIRLSTLPA